MVGEVHVCIVRRESASTSERNDRVGDSETDEIDFKWVEN